MLKKKKKLKTRNHLGYNLALHIFIFELVLVIMERKNLMFRWLNSQFWTFSNLLDGNS